jgi:hypothetical protein
MAAELVLAQNDLHPGNSKISLVKTKPKHFWVSKIRAKYGLRHVVAIYKRKSPEVLNNAKKGPTHCLV